jgi:hypothetical protein
MEQAMKSNIMPNLPCPVCGAPCRADVVLRHVENYKPMVPNVLGHAIRELRYYAGKGETDAERAMLRAALAAENFFWSVTETAKKT